MRNAPVPKGFRTFFCTAREERVGGWREGMEGRRDGGNGGGEREREREKERNKEKEKEKETTRASVFLCLCLKDKPVGCVWWLPCCHDRAESCWQKLIRDLRIDVQNPCSTWVYKQRWAPGVNTTSVRGCTAGSRLLPNAERSYYGRPGALPVSTVGVVIKRNRSHFSFMSWRRRSDVMLNVLLLLLRFWDSW